MSDRPFSVMGMVIDCESCELANIACSECVVSVLLGPPDGIALTPVAAEVADEHLAAIAVLADSGLVPPLRLRTGTADTPGTPGVVTALRPRRRTG